MKIILTFLVCLIINTINCQTNAELKVGSWYFLYVDHTLTDKWSLTTGFEERNYQTFQNYNLILVNLGVNYKFAPKFSVRLGYMYLDIDRTFEPDIDPNTIENRYYQQITYQSKLFKIPLIQRIRFEERFLESMQRKSEIHRVRYLFKLKYNINQRFYVTTSNESFLHFKGNLYAENRFIANIGLNATKKFAIEIGYLGHYINKQNLDRLHVGLFFKTDYRKKKIN